MEISSKKKKKNRVEEKSETYKALEKAVEKSGGNNLLRIKLKNMPKDFSYESDKTDKEILYKVLKEKYEL